MFIQNKNKSKKKQYTNIRILSKLHKNIKSIAESEQRNIDVITNRLIAFALDSLYQVKNVNSEEKDSSKNVNNGELS